MNNKNKQENRNKPKRLISKIVKRLNDNGLESINGGPYNYHKVYQVLLGRWNDINVDIAEKEVQLELLEQEAKLKRLSLSLSLS